MLRHLFGLSNSRRLSRPAAKHRFRPACEALETRLAPAVYQWTGTDTPVGEPGDFHRAENWIEVESGEIRVPGAADDAIIPPEVPAVVVSAPTRVNSLNYPGMLVVAGGALIVTNWDHPTYLGGLDVMPGATFVTENVTAGTVLGGQGLGVNIHPSARFVVSEGETLIAGNSRLAGEIFILPGSELILSRSPDTPPEFPGFHQVEPTAQVWGGGTLTVDVRTMLAAAAPLDGVQVVNRQFQTYVEMDTGWHYDPVTGQYSRTGKIYQPREGAEPRLVGTISEEKTVEALPGGGTRTTTDRTERNAAGDVTRRTRVVVDRDPGPPMRIRARGYVWHGHDWEIQWTAEVVAE